LVEAPLVLIPQALGSPGGQVPIKRLACGFQVSLRCRLERAKLSAEPSLAELASHERRLHANATVGILEHEAVAMRPNHDAKTAADVVYVVPAS
jgi:hypothetical protein